MPCPNLIFIQSDHLIQVVDTNSHTYWQTVPSQISWPTDLGLHCLQRLNLRVNLSIFQAGIMYMYVNPGPNLTQICSSFANSVDPDQLAYSDRICTVCHSVCEFIMYINNLDEAIRFLKIGNVFGIFIIQHDKGQIWMHLYSLVFIDYL